jgi:hypothetical protein
MALDFYRSEHEAATHGLSSDRFLASCLGASIWVRELHEVSPLPWPLRLPLRALGFSPPPRVSDCLRPYRLHHTAGETGAAAWRTREESSPIGLGADSEGRNWVIFPMSSLQRDGHWVQLADSHLVLLAR